MTLSIVARDAKTGDFGVCGYTDIAGYGSLVPHVSLKCAVATQAYVNVDNGIEMIELVDKKYSIKKSGEKIIDKDKNKDMRQMIAIGINNSKFVWTGKNTLDYKSSIVGNDYIVAGNCLSSIDVLKKTALYFEKNRSVDFPLRLINSIIAGDKAGGHIKKISYYSKKLKRNISKSTKSVFGNSWSSALIIASNKPKIWPTVRAPDDGGPIPQTWYPRNGVQMAGRSFT